MTDQQEHQDQDQLSPDLMSLPRFRQIPPPVPPDQLDPEATIVSDSGGEKASGAPASIPAFTKQRAKSYAKIAEALLLAAGGWLNAMAGADAGEAYLPDDDDRETIPPPLGRLAARRVKLGADPDQLTDIEDLGIAAVGIGVWLVKGFTAMLTARRDKRQRESGRAVHADPGTGE